MRITRIVETSIQAVSPLLTVGGARRLARAPASMEGEAERQRTERGQKRDDGTSSD